MATAQALSQLGIKVFRAGLWKPRTHPGGFDGVGGTGLGWLRHVKQQTAMLIATEVATPEHVAAALSAGIDLLWIGARTTANPFAVQQIADAFQGHNVPVLIKNPVNPDIELWVGAMQRLRDAGLSRIGAIHRGFTPGDSPAPYRNAPRWDIAIELKRRYPGLCILCDPSHIAGRRDLVEVIARQAVDMGFDGLFVESHCCPEQARSDAQQQLTPERLGVMIDQFHPRQGDGTSEELEQLRQRIDECDRELIGVLARRMAVVREIGQYKTEHQLPVVQSKRFNQMLTQRIELAKQQHLSQEFITKVINAIHEEAVRQQLT